MTKPTENELLQERLNHCDGVDCTCFAYSQSECACDADWTPKEVIQLRLEKAKLQAQINELREALVMALNCVDEEINPNNYNGEILTNFIHDYGRMIDILQNALSSTPAQSLAQHDNELLDKVIKILSDNGIYHDGIICQDILKLKVTP